MHQKGHGFPLLGARMYNGLLASTRKCTVPLLPGSPDRSVSGGKCETLTDGSCAAEITDAEEGRYALGSMALEAGAAVLVR